jgi:hypothetical protein
MMKRAEEKDTAAGYEDPFQPKQAAAAQSSAPAAGPQPVKTQAESSGRYASYHPHLLHEICGPAVHHQPVSCIWYLLYYHKVRRRVQTQNRWLCSF